MRKAHLFLVGLCLLVSPMTKGKLPEGFVYVHETVPNTLIEMRYASKYNFVGQTIDGYEKPVAILTKPAARALKKVATAVGQKGYGLKIYDAYRPQRAVNHFFKWASDVNDQKMKAVFYPNISKKAIFERVIHYKRKYRDMQSSVLIMGI